MSQMAGLMGQEFDLGHFLRKLTGFSQTLGSKAPEGFKFVSGLVLLNHQANSGGPGGLLGGTPGLLPGLGLIGAMKNGDPIGMAQSIVALFNPSLLFTSGAGFTPLGWFFFGASLLQTLFAPKPPKAWGVSSVTYGPGFGNTSLTVVASGDSFGTDRARNGLQSTLDYLQTNVVNTYNNKQIAEHHPERQIGLIAQRMPGLAWRASDAGDPGYRLTDIDPLTGEQRYPYRRFDDTGTPFSSNDTAYHLDLTDPNQRGGFNQNMVMAAYNREAIAPLWEVLTAKIQGDAGAPNAGLSEEERAAKAGYLAPLDTAYAASHTADPTANPSTSSGRAKRLGSFMAVALDLDNSGTISTSTLAQNAAKNNAAGITFNWDNQAYQKKVGWVNANDGFLVLDRDFNQSADNGTELLGNPMVADPAKGLRSLATWDTNGDGRIDANDPAYQQLKVWQDFNQDGNNTHTTTYNDATGRHTVLVQDENNGTQELRSLPSLGIVAIDYANGRYEIDQGLKTTGTANGQITYASAQTVNLQASQEGSRYTPVGAGIKIDSTSGESFVIITQVRSEAAVFNGLTLAVGNETIGDDIDTLYEDGQGGPNVALSEEERVAKADYLAVGEGSQMLTMHKIRYNTEYLTIKNSQIKTNIDVNNIAGKTRIMLGYNASKAIKLKKRRYLQKTRACHTTQWAAQGHQAPGKLAANKADWRVAA